MFKVKVYSNRDKKNLSHNLPNQIRTNKHLGLYPIARFYSTYSYTHDIISNLNPFSPKVRVSPMQKRLMSTNTKVVYSNAELQREQIMKDTQGKSGIYQ